MEEELLGFVDKLRKAVDNDNFINLAYEVTDQLEGKENGFEAVEPFLKIIEENPYADFGSPGPLVHYVEKFYMNGYEEKLIDSLKRNPTMLTVWMLNRIINGSDGDKKQNYIKLMKEVLVYPGLEEDIVSEVKEFLELHN